RPISAGSSTPTASWYVAPRSSGARSTSIATSISRAARETSATAFGRSYPRATKTSPAGSCSSGGDLASDAAANARERAGREGLEPCRRCVPPRHHDLAPVAVDRLEDALRDERRVDDDTREERPEPVALRKARRLDEARV